MTCTVIWGQIFLFIYNCKELPEHILTYRPPTDGCKYIGFQLNGIRIRNERGARIGEEEERLSVVTGYVTHVFKVKVDTERPQQIILCVRAIWACDTVFEVINFLARAKAGDGA